MEVCQLASEGAAEIGQHGQTGLQERAKSEWEGNRKHKGGSMRGEERE
jgi:hypothetical protein